MTLGALITIDKHAIDTIERIVKMGITDKANFV